MSTFRYHPMPNPRGGFTTCVALGTCLDQQTLLARTAAASVLPPEQCEAVLRAFLGQGPRRRDRGVTVRRPRVGRSPGLRSGGGPHVVAGQRVVVAEVEAAIDDDRGGVTADEAPGFPEDAGAFRQPRLEEAALVGGAVAARRVGYWVRWYSSRAPGRRRLRFSMRVVSLGWVDMNSGGLPPLRAMASPMRFQNSTDSRGS